MTENSAGTRDIRSITLDNGLHVITEAMPHVRSVAVGFWVGTGSRSETTAQNGISHFIEHMVFQGTEKYSAEQIARSVDSIGGNLDAYTSKELVSFNTRVLGEHLPRVFDILSELVLRPVFRDQDIAKEKGVVLEEIKMETDSPEYLVHDLFCRRYWGDHPLGRPIVGAPETIESFDRKTIRSYYDSVYTPANIFITAAGRLNHDALFDLVRREFESLPLAPAPVPETAPEPIPHVQIRRKESLEQVHLCLGTPAYPVGHERRYACYVLSTLLGGGMSSRLFQNIREKRGLAYSVFSELNLYHDSGCLLISAGASRETSTEVIRLTLQELRRFKAEPVSAEELRRAKDQLKGSLMLSLESTGSRMANLARQHLYFGRFFDLDEIIEAIEKVTAEELQSIAGEFFQTPRLALTALGNLDGEKFGDLEC